MEQAGADEREKIILPPKLQREMIKFFLKTSLPKIAAQGEDEQQPPTNSDKGVGCFD